MPAATTMVDGLDDKDLQSGIDAAIGRYFATRERRAQDAALAMAGTYLREKSRRGRELTREEKEVLDLAIETRTTTSSGRSVGWVLIVVGVIVVRIILRIVSRQ